MLKTNLFFGDYPINLVTVHNGDILFECKNVIGTFTQVRKFHHKEDGEKAEYYFGQSKVIQKSKEEVHIDCIKNGTSKQIDELYKFGNELISGKVTDEDLAYSIVGLIGNVDSDDLEIFKLRDTLINRLEGKNQVFSIRYTIMGFENEILAALSQAMNKIYDNQDVMQTERGASGDLYPEIRKIDLPSGERIDVPIGKMRLPGFSKNAFIETRYRPESFMLEIKGQIQKKFEKEIEKIINVTQKILADKSIYKNQLLDIEFNDSYNLPIHEPTFIDIKGLDRSSPLILSEEVKIGLLNVIGRLKDPEGCKKDGIDVRSTFLLSGIGGTGKTESMFREIAPAALKEKYTILYARDSKSYHKLLMLAGVFFKRNWRILLIIEDIDQAFDGERREELQQNILNTLDGGANKETGLISLLTTNYEEKLSSFFVRRVTDIIHFEGMDEPGAKEFIKHYVPKEYLKFTDINLPEYEQVYKSLVGVVPSLAKRIIDKVLVIRRARNLQHVEPKDILASIDSFKRQEQLSSFKGYIGAEDTFLGAFQKMFGFVGVKRENFQKILQHTYNGGEAELD